MLRHRASLVRLATSCKNRVHAVLADRGIAGRSSLWTAPGRVWLADLALPPIPRAIIQDCCGLLDALATPIGRLEGEIATLAKPDPRVQALMALPGIGKLTAMTLVAEIGDIGVPAIIAVGIGMLILFLALFLGQGRQTYALQAARCAFSTARALVGLTASTEGEDSSDS